MKRLIPFLVASTVIHAGAFVAGSTLIAPRTGVAGDPYGRTDRAFVVVVSEEDLTPMASTPCDQDASASTQAQEKEKQPKEEPEKVVEKEPVEDPKKSEEPPEVIAREQVENPTELTGVSDEIPEDSKREEQVQPKKEKSTASTPKVASNPHMRATSLGREIRDFQSKILAAIRHATFFPKKALKEKRHGQVVVSFTIKRDGTLEGVAVVEPSGCGALDEAAGEIIRKAAESFPHFPAAIGEETLTYTVPILFREKKSSGSSRKSAAR
jgi:periplasmic protein TonB